MLHDFNRTLDFSRIRAREYNRTTFNHEASIWIAAGSMQERFSRPISGTIAAALDLKFHDKISPESSKVIFNV